MYETPIKYIYVLFPHENIMSVKPTKRGRKEIRKLYHEYSLGELQLCTFYHFKPGLGFEKNPFYVIYNKNVTQCLRLSLFRIKKSYKFCVYHYLE